ncbi:MAG: hypothetical protein K8U57_17605 [Planctomycetes bacterium]|nr:hypothetical protein [Planctomycetota bacterium]
MRWPSSREYNEAVQDPAFSFKDADLRSAEVAANAHGLPVARSGGFADVYQFRSAAGESWAVKCFTREVSELHRRYQAISEHLATARETSSLPFMVEFQYLDDDIRIGPTRYPVVKMAWVEGKLLHEFVREHLDDSTLLTKLAGIWHKLGQNLRAAGMAHGDLQHGNVMLVRSGKGVIPQLIDYDGIHVPALEGTPASEIGHANYQHPGRDADRFHSEIDRFPLLLVYTAIRCLAVGGRSLWDRFDNGDNLLFKEADIKNPASSALCLELWGMADPATRALAGWAMLASRMPIREVPLLEDLIGADGKQTPTLTSQQEADVRRLLGVASKTVPVPEPKATTRPAAPVPPPVTPITPPQPPKRTKTRPTAPSPVRDDETVIASVSALARIRKIKILAVAGSALIAILAIVVLMMQKPGTPPKFDAVAMNPIEPFTDQSEGTAPPLGMGPPSQTLPSWKAGPVLKGHKGEVRSVAVSANGQRAISVGKDQTVRVWDLNAGVGLSEYSDSANPYLCVAISATGKHGCFGASDGTVRVWDIENGSTLSETKAHTGEVTGVCLDPAAMHVISCGADKRARVWHILKRFEMSSVNADTDPALGIAISPFLPHWLVAGNKDRSVRRWDMIGRRELPPLVGNTSAVTCVATSTNGSRVLTGCDDKTVRLWDGGSGKFLYQLGGATDVPRCVAMSSDGSRAVTGSVSGIVRIWDTTNGKELSRIQAHNGEVHGVAMSYDGRRAITCGKDGMIRVWLSPEAPPLPPLQLFANDVSVSISAGSVIDVRLERNGFQGALTLKTTGLPKSVTAKTVADLGTGDTAQIEVHAAAAAVPGVTIIRLQAESAGAALRDACEIAVTVLPTGTTITPPRLLVVSSKKTGNGDVYTVEPETGETKNLTDHKAEDTEPVWSPDGKRIAFVSDREGTPEIWAMNADGTDVKQITKSSAVTNPRWSPDGSRIAFIGSKGGKGSVWTVETDTGKLTQLSFHAQPSRQPEWSPDGKRIAYANYRASDSRWCPYVVPAGGGTYQSLATTYGGQDMAWSPGGSSIAFTDVRDQPGWRLFMMNADGKNVRTVNKTGNTYGNVYPQWSPDGRRLAYGEMVDGFVQVGVIKFDGTGGKVVTSKFQHMLARWSPDGKSLSYCRFEKDKPTVLIVSDADGQNPKELLSDIGAATAEWQPK